MQRLISNHVRSNVVGYIALFVALSGTAYAIDGPLAGQNTVGSEDVINGEVKNNDLGADSVGSGKIADRQIKNADLSLGASSSNTIADGGIQGIDIQNDSLKGADVDEGSLELPRAFPFAGSVGSAPVGGNWVFRGPTVNVTTTSAQAQITGVAGAPLGISGTSTGTENARIALCHDATPGVEPAPENFVGDDDEMITALDTVMRIQTAAAAVVLAPGTYEVGFCVQKSGGEAVIGDWVNGWVMLTAT